MPSSRVTRHRRTSLRKALTRPAVAIGVAVGIALSTSVAAAAVTTSDPAPQEASPVALVRDARVSLADARIALAEATVVVERAAFSGLELETAATWVDTRDLRSEIKELSKLEVAPAAVLPELTAATEVETARVAAKTAELRGALDAALDKRWVAQQAAIAAEKARLEAEKAAAALAAANTPEGAQAVARDMALADYGWGADQFSCLASLWSKESGWNYQAYNGSSGATGIPQALPGSKMASAGADWQTSAATQIAWGLQYISAVYGSPCSAWAHSQSTNWY